MFGFDKKRRQREEQMQELVTRTADKCARELEH